MPQYDWNDFTKKSLISIIINWETLILPRENQKKWCRSWGKSKLANYMTENNVFIVATSLESNTYNLELGVSEWESHVARLKKAEETSDILYRGMKDIINRQGSLSQCPSNISIHVLENQINNPAHPNPTCCICLDELNSDNFILSSCGHNYCKDDFNKINQCSICRVDLCKAIESIFK